MPRLAVLILTKNEEKNIEECIKSVSFADEVVVIDSGSTDKTQEKAESLGARFVVHEMDEAGFAGQRNFALQQTEAEWIMYLDADERVIPGAVPVIQQAVASNEQKGYRLERKNIVFGKRMHHGGNRSDYSARLYPREKIKWQGVVHESVVTDLPWENIDNGLDHYTYTTWQQYFGKFNHYTSLAAREMFDRGGKVSCGGAVSHAFFALIRDFILRKGFLDGFMGLVMAIMAGTYTLVKYLKVINLYRLAGEEAEK